MIAIVTETLSCLNEADCAAFGVSLAPLGCMVGGEMVRDRLLTTAADLPAGEAYSVPPSESAYRARFEDLLSMYDGVLCITASHRISHSHRHATMAAEPFGGRVMVVDSYSVAGGLFLLVCRARHLVTLGYPMSRIKAELSSCRDRLCVAFTANSTRVLEGAKKLSHRTASEPALPPPADPDARPVFHIRRGGIGVTTYASGEHAVMDEMLAVFEADGARRVPSHIVVHYTDRTADVAYLIRRIEKRYPSTTIYERPITLSLQVNLGRDIVGLIGD